MVLGFWPKQEGNFRGHPENEWGAKNKHKIATHYQFNFLIFKLRLFVTTYGWLVVAIILQLLYEPGRVLFVLWPLPPRPRPPPTLCLNAKLKPCGLSDSPRFEWGLALFLARFPCKQTKISVRNFIYAPYTATFCNFCILKLVWQQEMGIYR